MKCIIEKKIWKKHCACFIIQCFIFVCSIFSAQIAFSGTIGNLNLTIGENSSTNLNLPIGSIVNIQTTPGTVIGITLTGTSDIIPYGTLLAPDSTQTEWPSLATAQAGYNASSKLFSDSGKYVFTVYALNKTSGSIQILLEGKGQEDITNNDSQTQDDLYQHGIEEGKRICYENPSLCGISISSDGYSEVELEAARNEGYKAGIASCQDSSLSGQFPAATYNLFTNTLNIPVLDLGGSSSFWLNLQLTGGDPLTFVMTGFGENN